MAGHEGHRSRLRKRALETDMRGFQPHEVLEFLLTYAIPRKDVNPLAHALIERFGSLSGVLDAEAEELAQVPGMGENAAALLASLVNVWSLYRRDRWGERPLLTNRRMAGEYCTAMFARQKVESMALVCLDAHKAVLAAETLMQGTVDETPLYTRGVVECALRHHAHSVLLVHNHPSGQLEPSRGDVAVSLQVKSALDTVEVRLLDHIIVAGERYVSLGQMGLLEAQPFGLAAVDRAADRDGPGPR